MYIKNLKLKDNISLNSAYKSIHNKNLYKGRV